MALNKYIGLYTSYNVWANKQLGSVALTLSDEDFDAEVNSSFKSIRKTFLHIWDAEYIWLSRIQEELPKNIPSKFFDGTKDGLIKQLLDTSNAFDELGACQDILSLEKVVEYKMLSGENGRSKIFEAIMHCMNHSTYHRGQLVTLFRQAGVTAIPSTDLVKFTRLEQRSKMSES